MIYQTKIEKYSLNNFFLISILTIFNILTTKSYLRFWFNVFSSESLIIKSAQTILKIVIMIRVVKITKIKIRISKESVLLLEILTITLFLLTNAEYEIFLKLKSCVLITNSQITNTRIKTRSILIVSLCLNKFSYLASLSYMIVFQSPLLLHLSRRKTRSSIRKLLDKANTYAS